ncbi:winged helix-turn-helix transcriptional regulator [Phycicoccus sp. BSK3Z-2]|uniref:Winged helix-turn-helix transcriptional regulator n=1 Tax=Phycicoccus avicenniae TaxID=2828860 RepID=A0A941D9J6_9MICO|nr:winged helix-turn-helix domain-containing protein [Phycicoccus avicenniae]MBR7744609.1 winged helix-turn-helix transcriptional regulator [Phycicoccus avicenniae]
MTSLDDLDRRVSRLERLLTPTDDPRPDTAGAPPPTGRPRPPADTETFWALDGLDRRLPEDSRGAVMIVGAVGTADGRAAQWQEGALADDLLDDEWSTAAEALAALGHPARLRILQEVLRGVSTARDLAALEDLGTTGQVYHHLRQLVGAGWLRARRGGEHEVPVERVVPLLTAVLGARR